MVDIPTLETARLRLTALSERHFDDYAAMLVDPDSTKWVGDGQPLDRTNAWRSLAMLLGHWQLRGYGMWALERRDTGEFIDRAVVHQPVDGTFILPAGWGFIVATGEVDCDGQFAEQFDYFRPRDTDKTVVGTADLLLVR